MPNVVNYDIKDWAILHGTLNKSVRSCERIPFSSVNCAKAVSLWSAQNEFSVSIKHMEFFDELFKEDSLRSVFMSH
jgi:hypothetical protein